MGASREFSPRKIHGKMLSGIPSVLFIPRIPMTSSKHARRSDLDPLIDNDANGATSDAPFHQNPVTNFIIGLVIITAASAMNALGLNITKLDHVRNERMSKDLRRSQLKRPLWYCGLGLYIISQLIGSTLALQYMRAEFVAPLGSSSLIFNFIFARILLSEAIDSK